MHSRNHSGFAQQNWVGHGKECFARGRNETSKWAVVGMSQDIFHRDLEDVENKLPFG